MTDMPAPRSLHAARELSLLERAMLFAPPAVIARQGNGLGAGAQTPAPAPAPTPEPPAAAPADARIPASPLPFPHGVAPPEPLAHPSGPSSSAGRGVEATLAAIPAEFLADADASEDGFTPPPVTPGEARIDRGLLAEHGMIVPGAPVGPLAEEFRLVKRQLFVTKHRIEQGGAPDKARSLLVCSARPGDGKTFCAINLALSIAAERDTEVLLVDADVAKPDICRRLGLTPGAGLLDALHDASLDPEDLVIRTDVPHFAVLPAGAKTAMDTELLASARTTAVIARLLAANPRRLLVFDSPPALAASPAGVLAMLVGQVMLVVRADRTPESEIGAAVGVLDGCAHVGLLLNAVTFVPDRDRFGSYYGQELT
ncbi:chromosome partitioning protein [Sphingomonas sp.]|uniref:chromosome partitioning protein n=1 Tax=Sphingomonas sp. TaxID=28214 RepID=UPI003CC6D745